MTVTEEGGRKPQRHMTGPQKLSNSWEPRRGRGSEDSENRYYLSKKKMPHPANSVCLLMHVASEQIELESPGWSGFVENSKPDRPGPSSSIRLEVMWVQT